MLTLIFNAYHVARDQSGEPCLFVCMHISGSSLKRDPVDRDRAEDPKRHSAKNELTHISIALSIHSNCGSLIYTNKMERLNTVVRGNFGHF